MNKRMLAETALAAVFTGLLFFGCETENKTVETTKMQNKGQAASEEKKAYTFVDVQGEVYEAELINEVPLCTYDYEHLTWENGYPYYKDKDGMIRSALGVDVSKYQGDVDWEKVREAGMEFAILRLGFRGYGPEGKIVLDEYFQENMEGALSAGLTVGVYFFSQAVTSEEAEEEAAFVLSNIEGYQVDGPVVFDTEEIKDDVARTDQLTRTQITDHCIAFCDAVREAGKEPFIYANMKWMAFTLELERLTDYQKWYADYEPVPQCPYEFTMWQYTETGSVPGIQGNADLNVWFEK